MDFAAIDLGASSTRYTSNSGKIEILANNMAIIEEDTRVDQEPYSSDIEGALDVTIESTSKSEYFPVRVLIGQMAERFSSTNQKPSGMSNKYTQQINYISTVMAVALSKFKQGLGEHIQVYLALPPVEVKSAKDIVKKNLVGTYTITFHKMNNMQIKFTIDDVGMWEESFMALLAYFFDMNGAIKDSAKRFATGNILSMDIGASTTDLAVVQNMKYLEKSGQTYKTGGNVARDLLIDHLREKYGFDATIAMAELAMAEGRVQMGDACEDCARAVNEAKKTFAAQIVEQIQGYFRKVNIPIQTIRAIIVSGGGSMTGQYIDDEGKTVVTSEAISYFITEELNKVCNGVVVEQFSSNPRLANISGLFVRANIDIRKKMKEAEDKNIPS